MVAVAVAENGVASPVPPPAAAKPADLKKDEKELADLMSKLNPSAKEFFPASYRVSGRLLPQGDAENDRAAKVVVNGNGNGNGNVHQRKYHNSQWWRRRLNGRSYKSHKEESVRRTVYVSEVDHQVTEERLAAMFTDCGHVVDCRICGDTQSVQRFAFVEFADDEGARAALGLSGAMLGYYPVKVSPSKTAILPVNPTFLPRSENEREMCARTVYCTNIDKKVSEVDVGGFFETTCGEVSRLRLLGDYIHNTRIAFVEFVQAESAILALNCSGKVLGTLPIRISPSKTPVRPRSSPEMLH